ncbi:MAG: phytoene/squalene synthase family protein [Bacteroides sp.]|nr:phytoene/squalene synthase family protein [Bacteroides sp.]
MDELFRDVCFRTSRVVTDMYSTSFSIGVRCLGENIREGIYSICGFVRLVDKVVDTFHHCNKAKLLDELEEEYYRALRAGISLNPIVHAFQHTVRKYHIDDELVQAFLRSMRSDLYRSTYNEVDFKEYIYGSTEVVGLMCLKVFVEGDQKRYTELKPYAMRLGAAFQKINFLRDIRHDVQKLNRVYFPLLEVKSFNDNTKQQILDDIFEDYQEAEKWIRQLPPFSRWGVYTAYLYYRRLTLLIERTPAEVLMQKRIRVSNREKLWLFGQTYLNAKIY